MENINIVNIVLPIEGPEYVVNHKDYKKQCNEYEKLLKCFKKLSNNQKLLKLINDAENPKINKILFEVIKTKDNNDFIIKLKSKNKSFSINYVAQYLRIECILNTGNYYWDDISYEIIANRILKRIALLLNLSYIGPFTALSGIVLVKGKSVGKTDYVVHHFDEAYARALNKGWPRLNNINIDKTLDWFLFYNIKLDGISDCVASKAINALTYLVNDHYLESDAASLFWAMVGIESVFANGNENTLYQIREKTALVFGEPNEYKKQLSRLYNYRSRLIHGDINFPSKFSSNYNDIENFSAEYWEASGLATTILIATIREFISRNIKEFLFNYSLTI